MLSNLISRIFGSALPQLDPLKIPAHIAIIMDGNGRWATQRGLPRVAGHRMGAESLKKVISACGDVGVKFLTVYAFSTENWERPKSEVEFLMSLFSEMLDKEIKDLSAKGVRIRFLGRLDRFPQELRMKMEKAMFDTTVNDAFNLNIMVNYGGRAEIVDAVNKITGIRDKGSGVREINEKMISDNLYTAGLPDPDLLIRTAYERRVSNFMLWQIAYTELYFTKTLWPDFGKGELIKAIADYQERVRRFGRI